MNNSYSACHSPSQQRPVPPTCPKPPPRTYPNLRLRDILRQSRDDNLVSDHSSSLSLLLLLSLAGAGGGSLGTALLLLASNSPVGAVVLLLLGLDLGLGLALAVLALGSDNLVE